MNKLLEAIKELTEEVKRLRESQVIEHHYHYNHPPQYIVSPNPYYPQPSYPPYPITTYTTTGGGISAQPAT